MGIYRQYTLREAVPVITTHKCSQCGEVNIKKQFLTAEAAYNDKGAFTQSRMHRREYEAKESLEEQTKQLIKKVNNIDANSNFYRFDFDGKCAKCGHVEPWGKMKIKVIEVISNIVGVICIFDFLFMLLTILESGSGIYDIPVPMYVILAIGVFVFGAKYGWILLQKLKLKNYPTESLPKPIGSPGDLASVIRKSAGN